MRTFGILLFLMIALAANSQQREHSMHADKKSRAIASLSEQDIAALRAGTGWGLALPAELNGAPGPRHVLDLAAPLALTDEQVSRVKVIFDDMKQSAMNTGREFIAAEKALNDAFVQGSLDPVELERLVAAAGQLRADLRLVHLAAHLETLAVLSQRQVELYNKHRGYDNDPCLSPPDGHDAAMWKAHHGCN